MPGLKLMVLDEGTDKNIRCRFISEWCKIESYVPREMLLSEIEKVDPDAVILDINLFESIGGLETKRKIESQFEIPVWHE